MGRRVGLEREQFARCFGVNLAKARNAADVSQDELAFRTSTHRTAISQIERGLSLPGIDSSLPESFDPSGQVSPEPGADHSKSRRK